MLEPIRAYRLLRFFQALAKGIFSTYFVVYQLERAHFGPLQLVALGAVAELGILLFEVPTGAVADALSRKASVALGFLVIGLSYVAMGFSTDFGVFMAACLAWGIGETLISGAREAWASQELPYSLRPDLKPTRLFMMGSQAEYAGGILGIILSAPLAMANLSLPLLVSGLTFVLLGASVFGFLQERGFKKEDLKFSHVQKAFTNFRAGWRHVIVGPTLIAIMVVTVFQGSSSEGFDKLWQKQIKDNLGGLPHIGILPEKTWWAIAAAGALALAWIITTWVKNHVEVDDEGQVVKVLTWMTLAILVGLIAFAAAPNFWVALAAYILCKTLRKANSPLMTGWLNLHAPDKVRATVLSFEGQAHSAGKIVGGPAAGAIAEMVQSIRWAIFASAVLLLPAVGALLKRNR